VSVPKRDWMSAGARYTTVERRPQVSEVIAGLDWKEVEVMSLPAMPAMGIQEAIKELRLPKVSAIAFNGALEFPGRPGEDGEYPSLYGIEANYTNGRARVYLVDNGCEIVTVCADFWAEEEASIANA
jgi:hypothetical protein